MRQTVSLRIAGDEKIPAAAAGAEPVRIELGKAGPRLPDVGVVIYAEDIEATLAELPMLARLGPQQLLFHFDPTRGHGLDALRAHARLAAAYLSRRRSNA